MDERDYRELEQAIALAQHTVYKSYLAELQEYPLVQVSEMLHDENVKDYVRLCKLEKFSCKKGEDIFQKLTTVYHASMSLGCSLIVMIDTDSAKAPVNIYIGVRNSAVKQDENKALMPSFNTLKKGIMSNFPGSKITDVSSDNGSITELANEIFGKNIKNIASVSCVAAARDKTKTENKEFVQGIERFIDAMRGNPYTAIFIAEPISTSEQKAIRSGYENLYSEISSFKKSVWSYNENESNAVMESLSKGISRSVTEGTSSTQAHTTHTGMNMGFSFSHTNTGTDSHSTSVGHSAPTGWARFGQALQVVGMIGTMINPLLGGGIAGIGATIQGGTNSKSTAQTIAKAIGQTIGGNAGFNMGFSDTKSGGTMNSETDTKSETKTSGTTKTTGTGKTLQIETVNKTIEELLKRIEEQLKRLQEGEDYGSYSCGAYFLSAKKETVMLAANIYRALMIGEGSSVESGAINIWEDEGVVSGMKEYLRRFTHPIFALPLAKEEAMVYTPGTTVSGLELPLHLGLPLKSVYGLPVLEHAEFGRNVNDMRDISDINNKAEDMEIQIGNIYHMGEEDVAPVNLDVPSLASHTFITGSTGSGKSNTIYQILNLLNNKKVNFMVVEPAKGEYRKVFGNRADVSVYGTNNKIAGVDLLRINPFSFPAHVHVLEHLDRLVEIFNVCWPMYAAMPAILKDSIQRAYEAAGWNMETSENKYSDQLFPSFEDVYGQIRMVLNESEYSQDNKGDYVGSLVTRLRSLTTGINGMIFSSDEVSAEELFDRNVIIDLSRVGSSETKALIMGLMILKLQEYRMNADEPNQNLKHVTVLEEAHNLLRRTSTEQVGEGSNLLGKSVEMLANSIAEMRTYGEGFIIADQAPGLLDMSVIRNTNTKIILRLPDYSDRELVGRAASLSENQIEELAKLDTGVAAIKQGEWLETVLCKVEKYVPTESDSETTSLVDNRVDCKHSENIESTIAELILKKELSGKMDRVDEFRKEVVQSKLSTTIKCEILDYLSADESKAFDSLSKLAYDFFHAEDAIRKAGSNSDISEWTRTVAAQLQPEVMEFSNDQIERLMALIISEKANRDAEFNVLYCKFTELHK